MVPLLEMLPVKVEIATVELRVALPPTKMPAKSAKMVPLLEMLPANVEIVTEPQRKSVAADKDADIRVDGACCWKCYR